MQESLISQRWHRVDLSKPVDPERLRLPQNPWITEHNAQEHAKKNFMKIVEDIRAGNGNKYRYPKSVLDHAYVNFSTGEVTDSRLVKELA
jgi:hypothetical protein